MKSADLPNLPTYVKESTVVDSKKTEATPAKAEPKVEAMTETKAEDAKPVRPSAAASAAESSDPAVHKLLADRQTAEMNGDVDGVKAVDDQLAELGYK